MPQPEPIEDAPAAEGDADVEAATEPTRSRPTRTPGKRSTPKANARRTGRTVYIPDELWERIIVQGHRRKLTCSDYIVAILDRNVPDHRRVGAESEAPGRVQDRS